MDSFEQHLRDVLPQLTQADHARVEPPSALWSAIEAAIDTKRVDTIDIHRRTRRWFATVGVAAAVVLGLGAGVFATRPSSGPIEVASVRVSSDGLPGAPVGLASVARFTEKNSARTLILDTSDVPVPRGEYLELWLIDTNVDKMVSLGAARPDGRYSIPAGINLADYPVVDVSAEPLDGNPKHSGASLLRGIVTV